MDKVWRLDFVHETDSYTYLSDSVCCVENEHQTKFSYAIVPQHPNSESHPD